jgi:hypothetical protein
MYFSLYKEGTSNDNAFNTIESIEVKNQARQNANKQSEKPLIPRGILGTYFDTRG